MEQILWLAATDWAERPGTTWSMTPTCPFSSKTASQTNLDRSSAYHRLARTHSFQESLSHIDLRTILPRTWICGFLPRVGLLDWRFGEDRLALIAFNDEDCVTVDIWNQESHRAYSTWPNTTQDYISIFKQHLLRLLSVFWLSII